MNNWLQDLRFAVRSLFKRPGFALIVIFTLALGIGANTAIFSVINAVLLRPLPYVEPERIVQLWETDTRQRSLEGTVSPLNFNDWRNQTQSFEAMAAYRYTIFTLTGNDQPQSLNGSTTSASFFSVLGVKPIIGRDFLPEEDAPGKNRVCILSYGLWQRQFAGDQTLPGKTIQLNGESYTVAGVMPQGFQFPDSAELWSPLGYDLQRIERGSHNLMAIGRINSNTTVSSAQADLDAIASRLEEQYPNTNTRAGIKVIPLREQLVGKVEKGLYILLFAVGLVLLIACANVTNLLLVRATSRQKEIAIRAAIGASRRHLIRQFLIEGVLLAIIGGTIGLLIAWWGVDLILASLPSNLPRIKDANIDKWVLLFTLSISLLTGILSALAPAIYGTRLDLNQVLKESGKQTTAGSLRKSLRGFLVASEIALALVVLIGAGLLINSFLRIQAVNPGFKPDNLLTLQINLPRSKYKDQQKQAIFFQQAVERIRSISGIEQVSITSELPFSGSRSSSSFDIEGRPSDRPDDGNNADRRVVTPNYFATMGIPLVDGRDFTDFDDKTTNGVVIVNERWAQQFFPNENPIGKRIRIGDDLEVAFYGSGVWREVVGVVGNLKHNNLTVADVPEMYMPYRQHPESRMMVAVRGGGNSANFTSAIRNEILALDHDLPIYNIRLMGERLAQSVLPQRFNMLLLSIFAGLALVLASVGIYGVMSYTVAQSTREIGIRMALGAGQQQVLRMVLGQGLALVLIGIVIGLAAAFGFARLMESLLFGVHATDFVTFAGVSVVLVLVALLACYLPARRATKVDPMVALRYE
jgi:putative ABC transport system permease protein